MKSLKYYMNPTSSVMKHTNSQVVKKLSDWMLKTNNYRMEKIMIFFQIIYATKKILNEFMILIRPFHLKIISDSYWTD